jgi:hypothetical protein
MATAGAPDGADADLAVFVDRLAQAGTDRCTALAHTQIRNTIAAGSAPPGLRRLAEALAASAAELPPPRRPVEDRVSLVEAMRATALAVLDDAEPDAVAAAVGALVADGRRVIVTSDEPAALSAVRTALPPDLEGCSLDWIPAVPPAELRELRRLLAGSTPARRARIEQELPAEEALPAAAEVAQLCTRVTPEATVAVPEDTEVASTLLAGLEPPRRAAVRALAGAVVEALAGLPARQAHPWAWGLLVELAHSPRRAVAEELLADASGAVEALERVRSAPPVEITARLPAHALAALVRYLEFLEGGGRARVYFRSPEQREVRPVLAATTVGGRRPQSVEDIRRLISHLTIGARLTRVDARCAELGLPAPMSAAELVRLADELAPVVDAARAIGALGNDVLFAGPNPPIPIRDPDDAVRVAAAVLAADDRGAVDEAGRVLDRMADELLAGIPMATPAPEQVRAAAALRARDAAGYAAALAGLAAARREIRDERRCRELLRTLAAAAPRLAAAWSRVVGSGDGAAQGAPRPFGLVAFVPAERLLAELPPPDSADVVVVHRAAALGTERLLLAAVAPRMVATAGPDRPDGAASMLSVLRRTDAVVIGGQGAAGLPLPPRPRPAPASRGGG